LRGGSCEAAGLVARDKAMTKTPKIALVTGASRGLGAALAEDLAARGYHVLAVARTVGALEELDDRIRRAGGSATLAPMDVAEAPAMQQLAQAAMSRWGGLDVWAHCAIHAAPLAPAAHVDGKDWAKSVLVNMDVTRGLIALLEPLLRARGRSPWPAAGRPRPPPSAPAWSLPNLRRCRPPSVRGSFRARIAPALRPARTRRPGY
jgi:NAD(P)-dependent dehydrogenase (short-subunit alcohol dehydrogenase family)